MHASKISNAKARSEILCKATIEDIITCNNESSKLGDLLLNQKNERERSFVAAEQSNSKKEILFSLC